MQILANHEFKLGIFVDARKVTITSGPARIAETRFDGGDGIKAASHTFPTGAIAPDTRLPALPDGSSTGPGPGPLHDRHLALYQKYGDSWRVSDKSSIFDYAPGTSPETFTLREWPVEHPPCLLPNVKPVPPATLGVAEEACRTIIAKNMHANCVFDVVVTGNLGFAKTYLATERIETDASATTVIADENLTQVGELVMGSLHRQRLRELAHGQNHSLWRSVQLILDGLNVGGPSSSTPKAAQSGKPLATGLAIILWLPATCQCRQPDSWPAPALKDFTPPNAAGATQRRTATNR